MKDRLKKIGKVTFRIVLIGFIALLLVEVTYRWQWIDFYKTEWRYQQSNMRKPANPERRILVLGDSFSADSNSWANVWKTDALNTSTWLYNAAVPGIGPETHRLIVGNRLKEVQPTHVILQLYVGNDLYDIHRPVNWSELSFGRNLFWMLSNRLRVLGFINYRLGQRMADATTAQVTEQSAFAVEHYSPRTKMYISADNRYPQDAILLEENMDDNINDLMDMVLEIQEGLDEGVEFWVLVMPHCCQVNKRYVEQYRTLGASISEEVLFSSKWVERLEKHSLKVIDPIKILKAAEENGEQVYYENDPHLNPRGQQLVMEEVRKELKCFEK